MRKFLTSTVSSIIFGTHKLTGNGRSGGLRILTYHRVNDIPGDRLSVHPQEFERQMSWLKAHGYVGVSVKEGLKSLNSSQGDRTQMVITFDDGYLDNYVNAFPILKKYGFFGTVYVITKFLGESSSVIPAEAGIQRNGPPLSRGRQTPRAQRRTFLSWDEINEMNKYGIEFGSHTVNHPRLTSVDGSKIKEELWQSKQEIEQKLGITCESFCYPGGLLNSEIANQVREAGYSSATTVMPGANLPGADPFLLKRTEISGEDSIFEFEKKIGGAYDLLHKVWQAAGMLK